jgi:hypothetical protein
MPSLQKVSTKFPAVAGETCNNLATSFFEIMGYLNSVDNKTV